MEYIYRRADMEDVDRLWYMMDALDGETEFMLYEPGERPKDLARLMASVNASVEDGDLLLLCEAEGEIVGYIYAQRGALNRIKHTAYIVTGIRRAHRNRGIGGEFFKRVEEWARESGVTRLELTVMCPNTAAKHLYEKHGFIVAGIRTNSMMVAGVYVDEYYMARLI